MAPPPYCCSRRHHHHHHPTRPVRERPHTRGRQAGVCGVAVTWVVVAGGSSAMCPCWPITSDRQGEPNGGRGCLVVAGGGSCGCQGWSRPALDCFPHPSIHPRGKPASSQKQHQPLVPACLPACLCVCVVWPPSLPPYLVHVVAESAHGLGPGRARPEGRLEQPLQPLLLLLPCQVLVGVGVSVLLVHQRLQVATQGPARTMPLIIAEVGPADHRIPNNRQQPASQTQPAS